LFYICNKSFTVRTKRKSQVPYHTESIDFEKHELVRPINLLIYARAGSSLPKQITIMKFHAWACW